MMIIRDNNFNLYDFGWWNRRSRFIARWRVDIEGPDGVLTLWKVSQGGLLWKLHLVWGRGLGVLTHVWPHIGKNNDLTSGDISGKVEEGGSLGIWQID
jgi:hypothetical protein